MRKLRVGLDIDGVLYRFTDTANYLILAHRGVKIEKDWPHFDYVKDKFPQDWKWLWSEGARNHGLFRYGSLYKGSREFLQEMQDICDNVVITSRPPTAVQDTMDWLVYQKLPTAEVHILGSPTSKKSSVQPECDVYIDDAIHNAEDLMENTKGVIILVDRPWNQGYWPEDITRFHRAYSWAHIKHILKTLHEQVNRES